jgi:hypothetical protein
MKVKSRRMFHSGDKPVSIKPESQPELLRVPDAVA